ncbi:MAG: class I adenylate cyclase [Desulfobacteraceae bacterium]|jgi:adenylate cyclase class 1
MEQTSDIPRIIDENRQAFMRYTIARLRELLRNLPQARLDLFHILPFLLHVNNNRLPGYVESELEFYGIFRFERAGFFKAAVRLLNLPDDVLKRLMPVETPIIGLYLMGSAGTLTQTGRSDFDFWVIVREDQLGPEKMKLLERKLKVIEAWCQRKHKQDVTFFIMDIEKLRQNDFSTVDGESSGSAQKTLLKDEFYRTFIMIAGKIPLWAVLPPDLSEDEIPRFMAAMADSDVSMEDYIDTGCLKAIDNRECLGALLWQVYKARKDPVKSLIKSSLAASYAFMDDDGSNLVSTQVRNRFKSASIDDYQDDPYTLVFETIMDFYSDMNDEDGLELIRQCIFLRLWSYPQMIEPDEHSPKDRLLARFLGRWKPDRKTLDRLICFHLLSERERIAFEDRIFDKLSFLYELVLRSADEDKAKFFMKKEDITILKNRTAAFLQKKAGKMPRCSTWLQVRSGEMRFLMSNIVSPQGEEAFVLYEESTGPDQPFYTSTSYLGLMGFLFANRLDPKAVFDPPQRYGEIVAFFQGVFPRPDHIYSGPAYPERTLALLKAPSRNGDLESVDILSSNSWGEFYYTSIDVSAIESPEGKCYKITEFITPFRSGKSESKLEYLVFPPDALTHFPYEFSLKSMAGKAEESGQTAEKKAPDRTLEKVELPRTKPKPFLDLL